MLVQNNMRFGTDEFSFSRRALLISKTPFDATNQTSVEGFTISGAEPNGSARRVIFKIDDVLYKFSGDDLVEYTGAGNFDDVIANGNTVDELTALASIPAFVGKKIYPIIALESPYGAAAVPSIKIALNVRANTDAYEYTAESPEYILAASSSGTPRIADIVESVSTQGNGSVNIKCRLQTGAEDWTDWLDLSSAANQEATAIQFQFNYKVTTTDGTDSARVNSITVRHNMGATAVNGDFADIYSTVQNYDTDLQTCYVVVKHKKLIDSKILAYINFMAPGQHRDRIHLGIANGTVQQMILGVDGVADTGIDQNTLQLYANGDPLTDFDYNVEVGQVTVNTTAGAVITASYDYNHGVEDWREMVQSGESQPYTDDGTYMTRFTYVLDDDAAIDKKLSNIRLRLERPTGRVTNQTLGLATGYMQQIVLPHAAKQETIEINADWSYDPESQIITVVATKGIELFISYDYVGESIEIYGFTAGWAAAV